MMESAADVFCRAVTDVKSFLKRRRYRRQLAVLKCVVSSNMKAALSPSVRKEELQALVRRNLKYHEITADFLDSWKYRTQRQRTEWEGYDVFKEIVRIYGTAIVCSFHFGNYYLFPFEIARLGYRVVCVIGDQHKQLELIQAAAVSLGLPIQTVKSERLSLLRLVRELRNGKLAYLLIDEIGGAAVNEKMLRVPFLGLTLMFKRGVGALHYYTGLPIVPVVTEIRGHERGVIRVGKAIEPFASLEDKHNTIDRTVTELFRSFEAEVIRDPAQWQKWVDMKRYRVDNRPRIQDGAGFDLKRANLKISRDALRVLQDRKGIIMIDMNKGRYYAINKTSRYALELMHKYGEFEQIASRLRSKFGLTDEGAESCIRRLAAVAGIDG